MTTPQSRTEWTILSLEDVSRFLRSGVADEESRQLRESVAYLAQHIDDAVRLRRSAPAGASGRGEGDEAAIAVCAARLAQVVSEHQRFLTGLGSAWHGLYELGAYQIALRGLLRAIQGWDSALLGRSAGEGAAFAHFEPLAWRTLGEGLLLIDMYEQSGEVPREPAASSSAMPGEADPPAGSLKRMARWLRALRS